MQHFIIDFDGTFTKVEALEELAKISLAGNKDADKVLAQIEEITEQAMQGKISFTKALDKRLDLIKANKGHIDQLVDVLRRKITKSFARNKQFFKRYSGQVYIFSGGFKEFIAPIVKEYGIPEKNIYANTFKFNRKGNIVGFDTRNLMSKEQGKVQQLKKLALSGDTYVIGDGYTDYEMKESGLVKEFLAFTENIDREIVRAKADRVAPSFDEFLYTHKLPMSISYPKNRIQALVTNGSAAQIFMKEGYSVQIGSHDDMKNVSILCVDSSEQLDLTIRTDRLMAIGVFGPPKNIDLDSCAEKGIIVFASPFNKEGTTSANIEEFVCNNIIEFVNTGSSMLSVNYPNLALPPLENAFRMLHVHKNVPGVLANINSVLAKQNINIIGQYLRTNPQIGYLITDVGSRYDKKVVDELKKVPSTIKFRILY